MSQSQEYFTSIKQNSQASSLATGWDAHLRRLRRRTCLSLKMSPRLCPEQVHLVGCPLLWSHGPCFDYQHWPAITTTSPPPHPQIRILVPVLFGQLAFTKIKLKKEFLVSPGEKRWQLWFSVWVLYRILEIYPRNHVKRRKRLKGKKKKQHKKARKWGGGGVGEVNKNSL